MVVFLVGMGWVWATDGPGRNSNNPARNVVFVNKIRTSTKTSHTEFE